MFTGIIEETGTVLRAGADSLKIQAAKTLEGTKTGDSIAVNGVCLTVTALGSQDFTADVMPETLNRSTLGRLKPKDAVNLERAMAADGRFGGHMVSGHIDGTGTIKKTVKDGNAVRFWICAPEHIMRGIVEKGSVAVDGISLTVSKAEREGFEVSVIPHTMGETVLANRRPGGAVNLETDIIGKYIERLLSFQEGQPQKETGLTREFLLRAGF